MELIGKQKYPMLIYLFSSLLKVTKSKTMYRCWGWNSNKKTQKPCLPLWSFVLVKEMEQKEINKEGIDPIRIWNVPCEKKQETKEEKTRGPGKVTVFEMAIKAERFWSGWDVKPLPISRASLPEERGALEAALEDEAGSGWKGRRNSCESCLPFPSPWLTILIHFFPPESWSSNAQPALNQAHTTIVTHI